MIELRVIDDSNSAECMSLSVAPDQESLIATNAQSLAEAQENSACVPLGIYRDSYPVGFLMYEPRGNDVFSVHRLMVEQQCQRQGVGRRAMELAIQVIQQAGGATIYLSFRPENVAARLLYEGLGFVEHETEPDGEVVYRLGPPRLFDP